MAKQIGADRFGDFYTDGKVRKRREWRGVSDTLYDYGRWLGILMTLGKFIVKPRNIKAMFRYPLDGELPRRAHDGRPPHPGPEGRVPAHLPH